MAESNPTRRSHNFKDLTGCTFGRWTILGIGPRNAHGHARWLCRCQCGKEKLVVGCGLRNGNTRMCRSCASLKHGCAHSPEYRVWSDMLSRCNNPHSFNYHKYGGRGITVCKGWLTFENFFADMSTRPSAAHSIDRINNNGHYSCGHCDECLRNGWPANYRWATRAVQQRNKRSNRLLTHKGKTMCLVEWAEEIGVAIGTLYYRLAHGWSIEKTLTTPGHRRKCKMQ